MLLMFSIYFYYVFVDLFEQNYNFFFRRSKCEKWRNFICIMIEAGGRWEGEKRQK